MTWHWNVIEDGAKMEVYDHNDDLVDTLENDGNGFTIPDDVLGVMQDAYETGGPTQYNQELNRDAATENIRGGKPQ